MNRKRTSRKHTCPGWVTRTVEQLRQIYKGCVQAKFVNGVWQARLVWSEWDKEKKKPVKKERYLGVIKETGFVPKHRKYTRSEKQKEEKQKQKQEAMNSLQIEVRHAGWEHEPSYVWGADRVGREALKGVWAQIERLFDEWEANVVKALSLTWGVWGVWGVLPMQSTYRFLEPHVEPARGECHIATTDNQCGAGVCGQASVCSSEYGRLVPVVTC